MNDFNRGGGGGRGGNRGGGNAGGGNNAQGGKPKTELAVMTAEDRALVRPYDDFDKYRGALEKLAERCNLLAPAVTGIPPGWAVSLSGLMVAVEEETYPVEGGKRGLSKSVLSRIAAAAGVSWDSRESRRKDNGANPHYCLFLAVGVYRDTDGQWRSISGHKELDMREGSEQVIEIRESARKANLEAISYNTHSSRKHRIEADPNDVIAYNAAVGDWYHKHPNPREEGFFPKRLRDPEVQIRQVRQHILSHAETKARLRALRDAFGLRSSYTAVELARPFVVAKPYFHGRFGDPDTDARVAEMSASAALGSATDLFGRQSQAPHTRHGGEFSERAALPPPLEGGHLEGPDDGPDLDMQHAQEEPEERRAQGAGQGQDAQHREERAQNRQAEQSGQDGQGQQDLLPAGQQGGEQAVPVNPEEPADLQGLPDNVVRQRVQALAEAKGQWGAEKPVKPEQVARNKRGWLVKTYRAMLPMPDVEEPAAELAEGGPEDPCPFE